MRLKKHVELLAKLRYSFDTLTSRGSANSSVGRAQSLYLCGPWFESKLADFVLNFISF